MHPTDREKEKIKRLIDAGKTLLAKYPTKGRCWIAVKVIDIFCHGTTKVVEVTL